MNIVDNSRFLCHLPWKSEANAHPASPKDIVLVKGTTGMMAPKDKFVELAIFNPTYHPAAGDHWYDMNGDHLTDRGLTVTHWCQL